MVCNAGAIAALISMAICSSLARMFGVTSRIEGGLQVFVSDLFLSSSLP